MPTIPTKDILSRIKSFLDEFETIDAAIKGIHREYKEYYDDTGDKDKKRELYLSFEQKSQLRMDAIDKAEELIKAF